MPSIAAKCRQILQHEEPIFSEIRRWTPDRANALKGQFERLRRILPTIEEPVQIGLLGSAAAGKSTLLNAIAFHGQSILPTGGVGTLTAQATRIVYSSSAYFQARYDVRVLYRMAFGLRGILGLLPRSKGGAASQKGSLKEEDLDQDDFADEGERSRLVKQAALLVKGNQNAEATPAELLAAIQVMLSQTPDQSDVRLCEEDGPRIATAAEILRRHDGKSKDPLRKEGAWNDPQFRKDLRDHSAGFLAPIVRDLEVGYPWDLKETGLELVDLPGVGGSRDSYVSVTEKFIREGAQAIILVVDRAGLRKDSRDLLEQSGFLQRLMHSADKPSADPLLLFVVATKIDESADAELREKESLGQECDAQKTLSNLRELMQATLRKQLQEEFEALANTSTGSARTAVGRVIESVMGRASFHAVASTEYISVVTSSKVSPPRFISEVAQSGIPEVKEQIYLAVREFQEKKTQALADTLFQMQKHLALWCNTVTQQYATARYAQPSIERFRRTLHDHLEPLIREVNARQGSFREFVTEGLSQTLDTVLAKAARAATEDIRRYLGTLSGMHWASLRAAVRKGGTHHGVNSIELPRVFSNHLESQIVPLWQIDVLAKLSKRINELADDLASIVKEMGLWAKRQDLPEGGAAADTLAEQMRGDIEQLRALVENSSDELRDRVRKMLYLKLREPIASNCQKFVRDGHDVGRGTKVRILDFFDKLVPPGLDSACANARHLLNGSLGMVREEAYARLKPYNKISHMIETYILPDFSESQREEIKKRSKEVEASTQRVRSAAELSGSAQEAAV